MSSRPSGVFTRHLVALPRLNQAARQRGNPGNFVLRGVDFVYADDFYRLLAAVAAQQGYGCAEKDLVGGLARFRIDDLRRLQTLGEKRMRRSISRIRRLP